jgi:hypothetical protein
MSLSLNQKIKTLEDQILALSTAPPKLKVYNGFIPQYSMSGQSGPSRTPTKNIYEGGFPLGTPLVLKVGDVISSIYGVSIYRGNGTVGAASVNFQVYNELTSSWKDIGCYAYQYIDPTQNHEIMMNTNTFVLDEDITFNKVSILLNSTNTVVDSGSRPFWTMSIYKN